MQSPSWIAFLLIVTTSYGQGNRAESERLTPMAEASPQEQSQGPPAAANQSPGQISGHVLRADTGDPLADVLVTLSPVADNAGRDVSRQTGIDGSFSFADVAPRTYYLLAYRTGFVGRFYRQRDAASLACPPSCLSVRSGQRVSGISIRLVPGPPISQMKDDELAAAVSDQRSINFNPARLSQDGKHFAFAVDQGAVWTYDFGSRSLKRAAHAEGDIDLRLLVRDLAWGQDATLYVSAQDMVAREKPVFLAVTSSSTKVISEVPSQIAAAFHHGERLDDSYEEHNDHFIVTWERPCHGCPEMLYVKRTYSSGSHEVAKIDLDRNYIFDAGSSEVLYPKFGFHSGNIVILDLNTGRSKAIAIPVAAQALLDEVQDGAGHLVAYVASGSCEPDTSEEAATQAMLPHSGALRRQIQRVCFARLP